MRSSSRLSWMRFVLNILSRLIEKCGRWCWAVDLSSLPCMIPASDNATAVPLELIVTLTAGWETT